MARRCGFSPRSFAEAEVGCPLDHCGHCGQHIMDVDSKEPHCEEEAMARNHDAWRRRVLSETFEEWLKTQKLTSLGDFQRGLLFSAFMFGVEGLQHEHNEYTMGDCGLSKCLECHPPDPDFEDHGYPSSYE